MHKKRPPWKLVNAAFLCRFVACRLSTMREFDLHKIGLFM